MANEYNKPTQLVIANKNSPADCASGELVAQRLGANFLVTYGDRYDYYFDIALKRRKYDAEQVLLVGGYNSIPEWIEAAILEALGKAPRTEHFEYIDFIDDQDDWTVKYGIPLELWDNIQEVMNRLETVRTAIGDLPIVIRSGYRSKAYNASVGGKSGSQHLYGTAADVYAQGMNCYDVARKVYFKYRALFNGYGLGSNVNIHFDIRKSPTHWWYKYKSWAEWERNQ
jgi:hypothetical protein